MKTLMLIFAVIFVAAASVTAFRIISNRFSKLSFYKEVNSRLIGDPGSDLKAIHEVANRDGRPAKASLISQGYLFGDIDERYPDTFGQGSYSGDPDYMEAGDVDLISPYVVMSGDADDFGDIDPYGDVRRSGGRSFDRAKMRKIAMIGGGAAVAGTGIAAAAYALNKARQQRSSDVTKAIRTSFGRISPRSKIRFIDASNLKLNSAPIDLTATFVAHDFRLMLDQQQLQTPFYHDTTAGVVSGSSFVCTSAGPAAPSYRHYHTVFIQMGVNQLSYVPASNITITATLPTVNGSLVISSEPINATFSKYGNAIVSLHPWQIVGNKPLIVQGRYDAVSAISVTVSGLPVTPGQAAVNMIIPGSQHPWTITTRNAMLKGI